MSLQEVQARTAELALRLQALTGPPALAGGVLGTGGFADALAAATPAAPAAAVPATGDTGSQAVELARQQVGTPYVFGGEQPGGFDCSGLVQWTYGRLGVELPRTAAEQGRTGVAVSPADAQPGDLVYFDHPGAVDHIGIYAGNGQWVVAPHTGAKVRVEPVDLSRATSIRRVTGAQPPADTAWAAALPPAGQRIAPVVQQVAAREGVDPKLLSAVAWTESGFDPSARSAAGAEGLMQLMPRTAQGLGVDPLDPEQALTGGARYLKQQLQAFGGRVDHALAAYNAGPTAVRKAGGIPPYAETQAYVTRVLDRLRLLGGTA